MMFHFTQRYEHPLQAAAVVRRARYGMIVAAGGELAAIELRPWPYLCSWGELWPPAAGRHGRGPADTCRLYYNQPRSSPQYLALRYMESTAGTCYATAMAAVRALELVAGIKGNDALVCDALNLRISDRLLTRLGWEPHAPSRWHRNYIRRFYGVYPAPVQQLLAAAT